MMKIKKFNEFLESKDTLYIFDLDDTLVNSPSFEELAIEFLKEDLSIGDMLKTSVGRIGVNLRDLKWENGRIYVNDPKNEIKEFGNWVRKGKRVYLVSPNIFHVSDISLPTSIKELSNLYSSVENKCIVTARPESLRAKIESKLKEFGLEIPKFGLHMTPDNTKNAGHWKGEKIVEILNETGFKKAIFYDDNAKYISKATRVVKEKLPNIDWKTIRVL
jgi:hypothetical protein